MPLAAANASAGVAGSGGMAGTAEVAGAGQAIPPPWHRGTLRIAGRLRDGALVTAAGLSWHPAAL
ncbi:MAG TPA: hypothetical protein VFX25_34575, partial [Streptosporangiaceae bacterium]|nr:hypothetical protein [Streptosporangiaceae bacterium]